MILLPDRMDHIAEYEGEGDITFKDGVTKAASFRALQLRDGRILLFCQLQSHLHIFPPPSLVKFEGTTTNEFHIKSSVESLHVDCDLFFLTFSVRHKSFRGHEDRKL